MYKEEEWIKNSSINEWINKITKVMNEERRWMTKE